MTLIAVLLVVGAPILVIAIAKHIDQAERRIIDAIDKKNQP